MSSTIGARSTSSASGRVASAASVISRICARSGSIARGEKPGVRQPTQPQVVRRLDLK
jgi:hypothetical protein